MTARFTMICAIAFLVGFVLTGCTHTKEILVPQVVERKVDVPPSLLSCKAEPRPEAWKSQRDVGRFIVRLAEAGDDCRTKLGAVRRVVSGG